MWNSDNLLGKDTFDLFNVPVVIKQPIIFRLVQFVFKTHFPDPYRLFNMWCVLSNNIARKLIRCNDWTPAPVQWEAFVTRCPQNGIQQYQLGYVQKALVEFSTGLKLVRFGVQFTLNHLNRTKIQTRSKFSLNKAKILNSPVWTKCLVKYFSRSKIRSVECEHIHTRRHVAATLRGDKSLRVYRSGDKLRDTSQWQIARCVLRLVNSCANLCLSNRILSP